MRALGLGLGLGSALAAAIGGGGGGATPAFEYYDDILGSSLKGVWSLRKAVSGYSGPAIRIRDTTGDAEQDVGFDGVDLAAFTVTGNAAVVKIYDQSGNGADLVNTTAANQPILTLSATPAGKPAIKFNSTDWLYDATSGTSRPYMVADLEMFVGVGPDSAISGYEWIAGIPHATTHSSPFWRAFILANGTDFTFAGRNGSGLDAFGNLMFTATSGWGGIWGDWGNNEWFHFYSPNRAMGGGSAGSVTYPNSTRMVIGGNGAGGEGYNGYVFELIASSAVTKTNRARCMLSMATHFTNVAARGIARRYCRLFLTDSIHSGGGNINIAEVQLREAYSGADQASGGTASASSVYTSGFEADKAFDNNDANVWASGSFVQNQNWLQYDFGSGVTKRIREITLKSVNTAFFTQTPRGGGVLSSDDGTNWILEWLFTTNGVSWTQNEQKTFSDA